LKQFHPVQNPTLERRKLLIVLIEAKDAVGGEGVARVAVIVVDEEEEDVDEANHKTFAVEQIEAIFLILQCNKCKILFYFFLY
jgi:hypothetical protein